MFHLLKNKKLLIFLFFYLCSVPQVGCNDVLHVNGMAGRNHTVKFTLKSTVQTIEQVNLYQDGTKIHTFILSNRSCFSCLNHTLSTICIRNVSQKHICLIFTHLIHNGVYYLAVFKPTYEPVESNRVNLTVHPAEYTTYTTASSFNITSFQQEQSEKKSTLLMVVPMLFTVMMLVIVLLCFFYWNYRKKTDKTPAVNSTSAPQEIPVPNVTCVEYCVLDFPNRPGEKVRSTEERVEYSPIVFPTKKPLPQDNELKPTTQQKKIKKSPKLQHEEKDTDKMSEKAKTSKPKHQKCQKKTHLKTPCQGPGKSTT
ncbi:uncharacterized protein LOC113652448 [Tachysurus fulvidraco]|uniref:uncharacterized protein LOC113652448 n=1 Tax=Tachysurus fulvidraco TaxID=1234273 RepID=UPI000F4D7806|nr:uncharacterized protein LOC113652448 [Tachysurus fulvidraco]